MPWRTHVPEQHGDTAQLIVSFLLFSLSPHVRICQHFVNRSSTVRSVKNASCDAAQHALWACRFHQSTDRIYRICVEILQLLHSQIPKHT